MTVPVSQILISAATVLLVACGGAGAEFPSDCNHASDGCETATSFYDDDALSGLNAKTSAGRCNDFKETRNAYFGDLHVHTSFSLDAHSFGNTQNGPFLAYHFAKGNPIGLPPYDEEGRPSRIAQLDRPLDFAAVTDHAEWLGVLEWPLIRMAAEYNNRPCSFTTFQGYEYSPTAISIPTSVMLHRNVIFANSTVPAGMPISALKAPSTKALWERLDRECINAGTGCDVLAIPHNSNYSLGLAFAPIALDRSLSSLIKDPPQFPKDFIDYDTAALRARMEPVVEIFQGKGESECRYGINTTDELCHFEKIDLPSWFTDQTFSQVRNGLKMGLLIKRTLGINPFQLGFIGSTDTHNSLGGKTEEDSWPGSHGLGDDTPKKRLASKAQPGINPGGLAVVWAEENTRQAIYRAIRKREVYATSGTRPIVRFFGGYQYEQGICNNGELAAIGYEQGVPMGALLPPPPAGASPRFVVAAQQDATPLQRIQIIKGWADETGSHERVFDVAGTDENADPNSTGSASLCVVWADQSFDPAQEAFYYARVLEVPSYRWSHHDCLASQVDCSAPDDGSSEFAACCESGTSHIIQERAWTSPIWSRAVQP